MTVAVTWYRKRFDEVWCAADSRISTGEVTATDSGAKIFPVPVVVMAERSPAVWTTAATYSFGFAFAGNTLTATNTLALASACTQSLGRTGATAPPPSLQSVAKLFGRIAEHYIRDIGSRLSGPLSNPNGYLFQGQLFGFCPVERTYKAFWIIPELKGGQLSVDVEEFMLKSGRYYPFGSGATKLVEMVKESDKNQAITGKEGGVVPGLRELLRRDETPGVGGFFQVGVASRSGFHLMPILKIDVDRTRGHAEFLGVDVDELNTIDGHRIGIRAFDPDQ